jgi:hypothetical protein
MAYMNQEKKAKLAPTIKSIMKKYGVKGSISVHNYSSLVVTVKSGPIDFIENYIKTDTEKPYAKPAMSAQEVEYFRKNQNLDVNPYWYHEHFTGKAKAFLAELIPAMNTGNHDNSDIQSDYFDVGWYISVKIGKWNKPYQVTS